MPEKPIMYPPPGLAAVQTTLDAIKAESERRTR
jgi:hypothetical protein